jgi:hypothetical protein
MSTSPIQQMLIGPGGTVDRALRRAMARQRGFAAIF